MEPLNPLSPFLTAVTTGKIQDPELERHLVEMNLLCNGALLDMGEGIITSADFMDVLEYGGHDMDATTALFEDNVIQYGLW